MNKEQFAQLLNGRQYRQEMTKEEEELAKENGLLVCFGASDDLLEFRGIIYDDADVYRGGSVFLVKKETGKIGLITEDELNEARDVLTEKQLEFNLPRIKITADWSPNYLRCSWRITCDLKHAEFDIVDDGQLYCRGIVIEESSIYKAMQDIARAQ